MNRLRQTRGATLVELFCQIRLRYRFAALRRTPDPGRWTARTVNSFAAARPKQDLDRTSDGSITNRSITA